MDISQMKLDFNNDVIRSKKFILQAKTQTIHKLTKKAKQLKGRKGTDEEKEKFKRKAESIVSEILAMKKITPSELGQFAVRNFGNLAKIMDTPVVTKEKVMAKLLSHKRLNSKYQKIVEKYSCIHVETLLEINMKKLGKKKRKQKLKLMEKKSKESISAETTELTTDSSPKKIKDKNKKIKSTVNDALGDDEIEDDLIDSEAAGDTTSSSPKKIKHVKGKKKKIKTIANNYNTNDVSDNDEIKNDFYDSETNKEFIDSSSKKTKDTINKKNENTNESDSNNDDVPDNVRNKNDFIDSECEESADGEESVEEDSDERIESDDKGEGMHNYESDDDNVSESESISESEFKKKTYNVDRNKQDLKSPTQIDKATKPKYKHTRMYVDLDDSEKDLIKTEKIIDPFFMTEKGDDYMTVALPRKPDFEPGTEMDKIAANRRMRRAAMFGNEIRRPKKFVQQSIQDNQYQIQDNHYQKQNFQDTKRRFEKEIGSKSFDRNDLSFSNKNNQKFNRTNEPHSKPEEKLHPSWEAKKKNVGLVAFQGKKVVFDD